MLYGWKPFGVGNEGGEGTEVPTSSGGGASTHRGGFSFYRSPIRPNAPPEWWTTSTATSIIVTASASASHHYPIKHSPWRALCPEHWQQQQQQHFLHGVVLGHHNGVDSCVWTHWPGL